MSTRPITRYEFWQHVITRDRWLIRVEYDTVTGLHGPLPPGPLPPEPDLLAGCTLDLLEPAWRERLLRQDEVVVEATGRPSPILRSESLVYLGFREPVSDALWREHLFLGLFSEQSVDELTSNVPPLRDRIEAALAALAIPKGCHDYRKTVEIFNTFPKAELFFMGPETLQRTIRSFALLYRHGAVKVVPVGSLAVHGVTLLVIMPKAFHVEDNQARVERYMGRYFKSPTVLSRIIHVSPDYISLHVAVRPREEDLRLDTERLERGLTRMARPWQLKLRLLLDRTLGEKGGLDLWRKYAG